MCHLLDGCRSGGPCLDVPLLLARVAPGLCEHLADQQRGNSSRATLPMPCMPVHVHRGACVSLLLRAGSEPRREWVFGASLVWWDMQPGASEWVPPPM